ncbi:TonB-dependent receptor [Oceaniserpentilla sp. 4NH20-0058]|uniref:TonB-dependent receptor domain-containing protein n=1 Tax=Oceaniserpentilla sp. 4NH20-0058 TaxID=3127660 RepID=UPI00310876E0
MKRNILAGVIAAITASGAYAGEAVFYVTDQGKPVDTLSIIVDGDKKLVGKNGVAIFELGGGKHQVELSEFGEWAGEFEFDANATQNAEIKVDMIAGEAIPEINVYTPGQEEQVVVGQVAGYIESDETGGGVEGARISVEGQEISVNTNGEGYFELELPRGEYDLRIAHPSYGNRDVKALRILGNSSTTLNLNMSLSGDSAIEEVVAVGTYVPNSATAQQRDSSAVLSAIGSEQMARFGDSNAASALKRVAGVSLIGGQYAVVRGLKGRYISSTLNGLGMPSTDPMRRDVPLDLFPASVLGGIEIQKSYTPDLPGDTTGGSIRMKTKGLPDDDSSKISVSVGFNSQVTGKDILSYEGSGTDFIGIDDGAREVPSSIESSTNGGTSASSLSTAQRKDLLGEFEHSYNTKDVTAMPNMGISYSFGHASDDGLSHYAAVEYKSKWSTRENASIHDTSGDFDYERTKFNVDLTGYLVAGKQGYDGSEYLSKTIFLRKTDDTTRQTVGIDSEDVSVDKTTLQWVERQFISQQFSGNVLLNEAHTLDVRAGLSHTSRYEPDRRTYQYRNDVLAPYSLERRFSDLSEISLDAGLDHTYESMMDTGDLLIIKTGLLISKKDRDLSLSRYAIGGDAGSADLTADLDAVLQTTGNDFFLNVNTSKTDGYEATDSMLAIYQSYEYSLGEDWVFLAGARMESASQELTYPEKVSANNSLDSDEILPVISATWKPLEEWQFRVGVSNTLARPGLTELSQSSSFDPETDEQMFGNPDLEISNITNLDFRSEYYISDSESISFAVFNKSIDQPIEKTLPDSSGGAEGYTYKNSKTANLVGLELDFRVDLIDTDDYSGFVSGNFAYVDSEVTLDDRAATLEGVDRRELQGQSDTLANIQFGVDHLATAQTFTILLNSFSDRIDKVSRGALANEYEKGRMILDVVYKWDVTDNLTVKGKINNLTNEKVQYTQNNKVIESYEEGIDASFGVDYIF